MCGLENFQLSTLSVLLWNPLIDSDLWTQHLILRYKIEIGKSIIEKSKVPSIMPSSPPFQLTSYRSPSTVVSESVYQVITGCFCGGIWGLVTPFHPPGSIGAIEGKTRIDDSLFLYLFLHYSLTYFLFSSFLKRAKNWHIQSCSSIFIYVFCYA